MDPELAAVVANLPESLMSVVGRVATPGDDSVLARDRWVPGPEGAPAVAVRIYERPDRANPSACVVQLHGGGFMFGDLDLEHPRSVRLAAEAGCLVVSVDYRLAPAHPFPAALEDAYAVLVWLAANAGDLAIDADRVGVVGSSAGGGLAASLALFARDRGGPRLAFQQLICPVLDDRMTTPSMTLAGTPLFDGPAAAQMWSTYLGESCGEVSPYAAPARATDLTGLPPTFVLTAELDPLRDEGIDYAVRLLGAGVPVELHHYAGAFHTFDLFHTAVSERAMQEQINWLRVAATADVPG